jgi:hypothetical protein
VAHDRVGGGMRGDVRGGVRPVAAAAGLSTVAGVGLIGAAVVATRRLWFGGYVSEAGIAAEPNAALYQAGMVCVAVGLVLAALAVAPTVPAAGWLLVLSGAFAGVSGAVPCSPGCPLPPYEATTMTDLVHAAASVLAVGASTLAMGAVALGRGPSGTAAGHRVDDRWRRISRLAFWVTGGLVALAAAAMLGLGRGYATGLLERVILVGSCGWLIYTCAHLALGRPPRSTQGRAR